MTHLLFSGLHPADGVSLRLNNEEKKNKNSRKRTSIGFRDLKTGVVGTCKWTNNNKVLFYTSSLSGVNTKQ